MWFCSLFCFKQKNIMEKKITVREYFHALNILEEDRDVYVDCIDGIAVVGGDIKLTPKGVEKFSSMRFARQTG